MIGSIYSAQAQFGQGHPSRIRWGVDSVTHADAVFSGKKFFELVQAQAELVHGRAPEFWGRYIGSLTESFNLKPAEVEYLASQKCRILLIYNGHTGKSVATYPDGQLAATTARDRARELGVPEDRTVWIYCDIEDSQRPTAAFFSGWFETLRDFSGYGGGVYAIPIDTFRTEYCVAYVAEIPPRLFYGSQPWIGCDMHYRKFKPDRPCTPPAPTVIYQYQIRCDVQGAPPGPEGNQVDLDLANRDGFARMWEPPATKVVFWKFNPTTGKTQLLYSAVGVSWTGVDFGTAAGGTTNHLGQQVVVLGSKLLAMGDSPLAAYETEDLVTFTKRYAVDLAGDYDGRLTLRAGVTPWVAWAPNTPNVSPKIWEDNGLGFTQRFLAGAADPYLYHIAEGFGTMWATFTTILRKWTGGTIWADIYISGNTFDFMVWWSKQNRLMLARRLGSNDAVGEILAFDGAITPPPAVLSSITDRVGYMTVIGDDLYVMAIVTTNGVTGATWKIYRCTDLNTAILIGQGTLTDTVRPTLALVWNPEASAFYAAIGSVSVQKIYKAVSPASGGNPVPTSQLAFVEVYSAAESAANHIRDGVSFGTLV